MCTLFAHSLYPTLCSWIIRVDICRPLYPPKDNPWLKLPLIRSKMLLPFGHKQYFEADKQQNSNVSKSYFFSHKPTSEISDFSQSHTVGDTAGRSSLETKWRNCFFFSEFNARDKPISSILDLLSKILVNWFYKLNEIRLLTLTFQPRYHLWRLFNTNRTKIHLCLVATFVNWIPWKSLHHTVFLFSVTYEKYAIRFPDVVVVLILRVF